MSTNGRYSGRLRTRGNANNDGNDATTAAAAAAATSRTALVSAVDVILFAVKLTVQGHSVPSVAAIFCLLA